MPLQVFKDPKAGKFWTAPQGVGHILTDTDISGFGNVIEKPLGEGTAGYTPIDPWMGGGGGTFGAPVSYTEAIRLLPNAGQPIRTPGTVEEEFKLAREAARGVAPPISQPSVTPATGQVQVSKDGVSMNIPTEQVANWKNAGWTTQGGVNVPQAPIYNPLTEPVNITPEGLKPTTPINIPTVPTTGTNQAGAMVTGATTNLQDIINQFTVAQTESEKKQQTILDQMATLTGEQAKKAADQLTQEQAANLPQLRQQFTDINAQILSKAAEYNVLSTENQNKPITMNSIIGNERAIMNAKAADIGLLQARALGLQGQITTAQETVNRAIDLKYSTVNAQLNTYQAQLNALIPSLNKEEKIQAQARQLLIDQQKEALEQNKTEQKNIQNVMLEYIKAGGTDTNVMSQISGATTYNQALQILGQNRPSQDVQELIKDYPDAGILPTDNLAVAQQKMKTSKIYQQATRLIGGAKGVTAKTILTDQEQYTTERSQRILNNIEDVKPSITSWVTGLSGKLMSKIPGTSAYDLVQKLDTLKSNIAFNELQEMRNASKTGGALGQVAVRELELLERTLGSLEIGLSKEVLLSNLEKVKEIVSNWNQVKTDTTQETQINQGFSVKTPDGKTYYFSSQKALDSFKKTVGL